MTKLLLTFFCSILLTKSFCQQYKTNDIIKKADSILISKVGQRIFNNFFSYDSGTYYEYITRNGKVDSRQLTKDKTTRGDFKKIWVRYFFNLEISKTWTNRVIVNLDSLLNLGDTLNTSFIPDCVWNNKLCDFITRHKALEIAELSFKGPTLNSVIIDFDYSKFDHRYVWKAINYLDGNEMEIVKIDALSSEVISYEKFLGLETH